MLIQPNKILYDHKIFCVENCAYSLFKYCKRNFEYNFKYIYEEQPIYEYQNNDN